MSENFFCGSVGRCSDGNWGEGATAMTEIHGNLLRRASKASCVALAIGFVLWNAAVPQKAASDSYEAARSNAEDRKSTRLNSSHQIISYAVFCLKKKK